MDDQQWYDMKNTNFISRKDQSRNIAAQFVFKQRSTEFRKIYMEN